MKAYLNFDHMLGFKLIKGIHLLGIGFICVVVIAGVFSDGVTLKRLLFPLGGLVGFVIWRLVCESAILLYSIHAELSEANQLNRQLLSKADQVIQGLEKRPE